MSADDYAMARFGYAALEFILFWLFCAFLAAGIGGRKGEGVMGFFYGLLLGPFGVLATYFSAGNRAPCPHCKEMRFKAATICPHCRTNLTGSSSPPA